ncbi:MAG: hypothetical protein Kow00109_28020 [Acidobacteriota bacterium]
MFNNALETVEGGVRRFGRWTWVVREPFDARLDRTVCPFPCIVVCAKGAADPDGNERERQRGNKGPLECEAQADDKQHCLMRSQHRGQGEGWDTVYAEAAKQGKQGTMSM